MMEGSGAGSGAGSVYGSVLVTNGPGCGSWRRKNIRILNTGNSSNIDHILRIYCIFYDDGSSIPVRCCCLSAGSAASVLRPGAGLDCQHAGRGHLQAGGPATQRGLHHLILHIWTIISVCTVQYTCRRKELTLVHNAEEENRTAEEGRATESPPEGDQC